MNKHNISELLFGLIFTIIIFFILDVVVPNMNRIIRVSIVLVLVFLVNLIFRKFFSNSKKN